MPTNRPSYGLSLDKVLACCFVALMLVATKYLLKHRPSLVYKARETAARAMGTHTYPYPRPALTVDAVIVSKPAAGGQPKILLIQRKNPPCKGQWALPGGFVDEGEPLDTAAARELEEETSVNPKDVDLFQVGAYGDPGRDPRGWTVTVAYAAIVPGTELGVKAADDAAEASWYPVTSLPQLAFDHKQIIREALEKLSGRSDVQKTSGMADQLKAGAETLQGPWTPPTE